MERKPKINYTKKDIDALAYRVIGAAIDVHKKLGPGLLESVYQKCLLVEFKKKKIGARKEKKIELIYDGIFIDEYYKVDFLVEDTLIVEVKAVDQMSPIFKAQLLTYMTLAQKPKGILINFNCLRITDDLISMVSPSYALLPD